MKYLIALALLALSGVAGAQSLVNCAPATPCSSTTGPANTGTGDAAWKAFGKLNEDISGGIINSSNLGNSVTATGLLAAPAGCTGGQFSTGIDAFGVSTCATPGGTGTINSGLFGNLAYYGSAGTAVSPLVVTTNTVIGSVGAGAVALTPAQVLGILGTATCNAQTVSYQVVLGDANSCVTENSGSATTLTIPLNATVAYAVGTTITFQQLGVGTVSIAIAGGVTIQQAGAITYASLGGQFGFESFSKVATDTWQLSAQGLGNTKFTVGGSCTTPAATAGGATGGTITLPGSGTVASCTLIVTPGGGLTTANLWVGRMCDRSQLTVPCWGASASGTTTITFTIPAATVASDVLSFNMDAE